jgi:hypothetical protein
MLRFQRLCDHRSRRQHLCAVQANAVSAADGTTYNADVHERACSLVLGSKRAERRRTAR